MGLVVYAPAACSCFTLTYNVDLPDFKSPIEKLKSQKTPTLDLELMESYLE